MILRHVVKSVLVGGLVLATACAPAAAPTPTPAPAKPAAAAKPAEAKPAVAVEPTAAPKPAAAAPAAKPTAAAKTEPAAKSAEAAKPTAAARPAEAAKPAAASPAAKPAAAPAGPMQKVVWGEIGGLSDAAFFIAKDKGYFREQGIELEQSVFRTAAQMVPPLASGQLDVGGGAPGAGLFNAIGRELAMHIVADKGHEVAPKSYSALVVRKALVDSGEVKTVADLKGRKIALAGTDISPEVSLNALLETAGLSVKDVEPTPLAFPEMVVALASGAIDGGIVIEPFVTQAVSKGDGVVFKRVGEWLPNYQTAVVLYSPQFVRERPEVAERFMVAYLKAVRDYNDAFVKNDPAARREVINILINNTPVKDPALYEQMGFPGLHPDGRLNRESLDFQQNYFVEKGAQQTKLDLGQVINTRFIEAAARQLGAYR